MRRLGIVLAAALLTAAVLPASVAAVGEGRILHGGNPNADVTVTCWLDKDWVDDHWEGEYDILATVSPELLLAFEGYVYPIVIAWERSSAKASAPAVYLTEYWDNFDNAFLAWDVYGGPLWGYVSVNVGYYAEADGQFHSLGTGVAKCQRGDIPMGG